MPVTKRPRRKALARRDFDSTGTGVTEALRALMKPIRERRQGEVAAAKAEIEPAEEPVAKGSWRP